MYRIHVFTQLCKGSHQIRRTTCTCKPVRTRISIGYFQKGIIIEFITCQIGTGEDTVVQRSLYHICIFCVFMYQIHSLIPVRKRNGSTGFTIRSIIGKLIISTEIFSMTCHTDSACDISLSVCNRIPYTIHCVQISLPVRIILRKQGRQIRYTCIEIACTYGMSHAVGFLLNRSCILRIIISFIAALS